MGSFTEIVLSFDFAPATPDEVLAAFSALGDPADGAPQLPQPVGELAGTPDADDEDFVDLFEDDPWSHDWASWVTIAHGIQTTPHGRLTWTDDKRWNLDCRFSWKLDTYEAREYLEWLAPYVDTTPDQGRRQIGTAHYEYQDHPCLLWIEDGALVIEDPNDSDDGSPTPPPVQTPLVEMKVQRPRGAPIFEGDRIGLIARRTLVHPTEDYGWNPDTGRWERLFLTEDPSFSTASLQIVVGGRQIVVKHQDGPGRRVYLAEASNLGPDGPRTIRPVPNDPDLTSPSVAASADGKLAVIQSEKRETGPFGSGPPPYIPGQRHIRAYDRDTTLLWERHDIELHSPAWSPNGKKLIVNGDLPPESELVPPDVRAETEQWIGGTTPACITLDAATGEILVINFNWYSALSPEPWGHDSASILLSGTGSYPGTYPVRAGQPFDHRVVWPSDGEITYYTGDTHHTINFPPLSGGTTGGDILGWTGPDSVMIADYPRGGARFHSLNFLTGELTPITHIANVTEYSAQMALLPPDDWTPYEA